MRMGIHEGCIIAPACPRPLHRQPTARGLALCDETILNLRRQTHRLPRHARPRPSLNPSRHDMTWQARGSLRPRDAGPVRLPDTRSPPVAAVVAGWLGHGHAAFKPKTASPHQYISRHMLPRRPVQWTLELTEQTRLRLSSPQQGNLERQGSANPQFVVHPRRPGVRFAVPRESVWILVQMRMAPRSRVTER
ncbi:hypothetical protein B0T22DRAFT_156268 [Podospora appendiculata]|uniref:Uncharacterized protein n=1 Tax=Podospora appendiculata TaxID=314037 RepID=A0AAE1CCE0_9PEZI|nr:hypothetical protein B0T22DRAFT_156268 [Podospora appendiculata]